MWGSHRLPGPFPLKREVLLAATPAICSQCGWQRCDRPAEQPDPPWADFTGSTLAPPMPLMLAAFGLPHGRIQNPDTPGLGGDEGLGHFLWFWELKEQDKGYCEPGTRREAMGFATGWRVRQPESIAKWNSFPGSADKCGWRVCLSSLFPKARRFALTSLHNHVSRFCIINILLYIFTFYWTSFSGESWLT